VARIAQPFKIIPGQAYRFPVAMIRCHEIRIDIQCQYPYGLSSLAKTYLAISYEDASGATRDGFLPIPPAQLKRDLRIPTAYAPIKNIFIKIISPGAFNPKPSSIKIDSITLVARSP
jgi:hypothetical protein